MGNFIKLTCPICLTHHSPKKWGAVKPTDYDRIGAIFESKGRGKLRKIGDIGISDHYSDESDILKGKIIEKLLRIFDNWFMAGVFTQEDIKNYMSQSASHIGKMYYQFRRQFEISESVVEDMRTKRYSVPFVPTPEIPITFKDKWRKPIGR